jgi:hypothetical protein
MICWNLATPSSRWRGSTAGAFRAAAAAGGSKLKVSAADGARRATEDMPLPLSIMSFREHIARTLMNTSARKAAPRLSPLNRTG